MSIGATATAAQNTPGANSEIRVMVVDDSVVVRGLVSRWLSAIPGVNVVSSQRNGALAVENLKECNPDVVVLDIEMPEMDGLTALPKMLAVNPALKVIMASTLTRRNAEVSLRALSLGASDYVPKPDSNSGLSTSEDFRRELSDKVVALGRSAKPESKAGVQPAETPAGPAETSVVARTVPAQDVQNFSLRKFNAVIPRIVAIGSSTGGPQALFEVTKSIAPAISKMPVVITQHMPPTFTAILAEHIAKSSGVPCKEADHGEVLRPGHIYVAPGGKHMRLAQVDGAVCAQLDDEPPINFCKPAVDPLFESASKVYKGATLAIVLTGMGSDGANGAKTVVEAGGNVIAQDKETSVVWGMPGATAAAGVCAAVLPLAQIGPRIVRAISGVA